MSVVKVTYTKEFWVHPVFSTLISTINSPIIFAIYNTTKGLIPKYILFQNVAIKPYINRYSEFRYWFGQQAWKSVRRVRARRPQATNQRRACDRCARNSIVVLTIVRRTKLGWRACESKHLNGTLLHCNKITVKWWYTVYDRRRSYSYRMTQILTKVRRCMSFRNKWW